LSYDFIRFEITRAKALQTVILFSRETRRRFAALKSNVVTLIKYPHFIDKSVANNIINHLLCVFLKEECFAEKTKIGGSGEPQSI